MGHKMTYLTALGAAALAFAAAGGIHATEHVIRVEEHKAAQAPKPTVPMAAPAVSVP